MNGYDRCVADKRLFHILARLKPPPSPGTLTSDSLIYVLPVVKLMGLPAAAQLAQKVSGAAIGAGPHFGLGATQFSPNGIPPGLQQTIVSGAFGSGKLFQLQW